MSDSLLDPLISRGVFPMVKVGGRFALPYGEAGRARIRDSGEYGEDFLPLLERVCRALTDPQWPPGSYYPGGWYRSLTARGESPAEAEPTPEGLRPFYGDPLRVDRAGRWWLGRKEVKGRVRRFFLEHLEFDPEVRLYRVRYPLEAGEEVQYLQAEAPPLRVEGFETDGDAIRLTLNDGSEAALDLDSLRLDAREQLFCTLPERGMAAMFSDRARWRIVQTLEQDGDHWWVTVGNRRVALQATD